MASGSRSTGRAHSTATPRVSASSGRSAPACRARTRSSSPAASSSSAGTDQIRSPRRPLGARGGHHEGGRAARDHLLQARPDLRRRHEVVEDHQRLRPHGGARQLVGLGQDPGDVGRQGVGEPAEHRLRGGHACQGHEDGPVGVHRLAACRQLRGDAGLPCSRRPDQGVHPVAAQLGLESEQERLAAHELLGRALEGRTPRSAGSRRKRQRLVVAQDLLLQGLHPPAGHDAEVRVQASRQVPEHVQGLDLRTAAVEGEHEAGRDLLVVRSLGGQVHQLVDDEQMSPECEVGVDPRQARHRVQPAQPLALDLEARQGGDTLEEVAAIEAQRRTQQPRRLGRTAGDGLAPSPGQLLEAQHVDVRRLPAEPVDSPCRSRSCPHPRAGATPRRAPGGCCAPSPAGPRPTRRRPGGRRARGGRRGSPGPRARSPGGRCRWGACAPGPRPLRSLAGGRARRPPQARASDHAVYAA